MNNHEARLWNEVLVHAQAALGMATQDDPGDRADRDDPRPALEMDEDGLRAARARRGPQRRRWDYLFSAIKKFRTDPRMSTPDQAQLTMTVPFMRAYTELLVQTCHARGAHAIGGMAAFIPNPRDEAVTATAMAKVRADKERESGDGFDGTWSPTPTWCRSPRKISTGVLGDRPNQKERSPRTRGCNGRGGGAARLLGRGRGRHRRRGAREASSRRSAILD